MEVEPLHNEGGREQALIGRIKHEEILLTPMDIHPADNPCREKHWSLHDPCLRNNHLLVPASETETGKVSISWWNFIPLWQV